MIRVCQQCGTKFDHRRKRVFCSEACRVIACGTRVKYNSNFLDEDTPFRAYFMGLWITDGYFAGKNAIGFASTDRELVDIVVKYTEYKNAVTVDDKRRINPAWSPSYKVRFSTSNKLAQFGYFPGPKTGKEFVPAQFVQDNFYHFLRGVVDGDGCLYVNKRNRLTIEIVSASKLFLETLQTTLQKNGDVYMGSVSQDSRTKLEGKKPLFKLRFAHQDATVVCSKMYRDSDGLRLTRKYEKFLSIKDEELSQIRQRGRVCSVEECSKPSFCKGMCEPHCRSLIKFPNYLKSHPAYEEEQRAIRKLKYEASKNDPDTKAARAEYYELNKKTIREKARLRYNSKKSSAEN